MKCVKVEKTLDDFYDGELPSAEMNEIETHLEYCNSCQMLLENLQVIGGTMKQHLAVSAPASLDAKVMSAFNAYQNGKQVDKSEPKEKIGWFGIPRFAFATALVLFALAIGSAFQIGKMSATDIRLEMPITEVVNPLPTSNIESDPPAEITNKLSDKTSVSPIIKYVEVPVVKEKIVTRTIYVNRESDKKVENKTNSVVPAQETFALKSSVDNNGYLTQTNLKEFQPVSEIIVKITKKDEKNEN